MVVFICILVFIVQISELTLIMYYLFSLCFEYLQLLAVPKTKNHHEEVYAPTECCIRNVWIFMLQSPFLKLILTCISLFGALPWLKPPYHRCRVRHNFNSSFHSLGVNWKDDQWFFYHEYWINVAVNFLWWKIFGDWSRADFVGNLVMQSYYSIYLTFRFATFSYREFLSFWYLNRGVF